MRLLQRLLLLALAHLHHGASSTALADKEDGGSSGDWVCRGQCQRLNLWQVRVPATGSSVLLGIIKAAGAPPPMLPGADRATPAASAETSTPAGAAAAAAVLACSPATQGCAARPPTVTATATVMIKATVTSTAAAAAAATRTATASAW